MTAMRLDVWQSLHDDLEPGVQPDQETFAVALGPRQVLLPIRALPDSDRGVASLILNQASFDVLDALAATVAEGLRAHAPEVIVAVPTLGLPLAEAVARAYRAVARIDWPGGFHRTDIGARELNRGP